MSWTEELLLNYIQNTGVNFVEIKLNDTTYAMLVRNKEVLLSHGSMCVGNVREF